MLWICRYKAKFLYCKVVLIYRNKMGKVNLTISDKLEKEFREEAFKEKGMKKGFLTDATEEAIQLWVNHIRERRRENK